MCFWPEPNYTGNGKVTVPPELSNSETACHNLLFPVRSAKNSSTQNQRLFTGANCTGDPLVLYHDNKVPLPSIAILSYKHT